MARSKVNELDCRVAGELGLPLADKTLNVKQAAVMRDDVEGFYMVFQQSDQLFLDAIPYWGETSGLRLKPDRFILHQSVHNRLEAHCHKRWYYVVAGTVYPLQQVKYEKLQGFFWLVVDDTITYRPTPLLELERFQLRKKALLTHRQRTTWQGIYD